MKRQLVAIIDCGTSSVRCIVFDINTGEKLCAPSRDWYVPESKDNAGFYDFDDVINWKLLCECTQSAMSKINKDDLVCVTSTGFRHGIFGTAKNNDQVIFGSFNMDSRCDNMYLRNNGFEQDVFDIGGDWSNLHGISRLLWLKNNEPETFEKIGKFMFVSDWVTYKLSAEIAVEHGNASSSLLMDVMKREWSDYLCERCGFSKDIYPTLVDAGTCIGEVTKSASEQTGLPAGLKVVCGIADTQAGLVGVGATQPGTSAVVGGSYWLDCHITDHPRVDPLHQTRLSCHSVKDQWVYEGLGFYVGLTVRWFRDAFGQQEKWIEQQYGIDAFYLLNKLAEPVPPGSYGLQVLFADVADQSDLRMCAPTFMGWDVLHPNRSHKGVFFRAILENACYQAYGEYQKISRILEDNTIPDKVLLAGGAAKSRLWAQILADVLQKPVQLTKETEATCLGAAIHAAAGLGIYGSIEQGIGNLISSADLIEPNVKNRDVYMNEFRRWRELYKNGLTLLDRGLVRSMYQADGSYTDEQLRNPWKL